MQTIEHSVVCSDKAALQVVEYPGAKTAPLVLLLPGNGGGINRFKDVAEKLCGQGFRCVAMNYRGAGASTEGDTQDLTLHDYAADAATVIRQFGREAIVLGNAFGNRVARCLGNDHPALVAQIVLVCAGGQIAADPEVIRRMMDINNTSLPRKDRIAAAAETLFAPGNPVPDWFIDDNRSARAAQLCGIAMSATQDNDWQSGGSGRMLIIQGSEDRVAVPANATVLQERFPARVAVQIIDNAGHAVLNEQPAAVTQNLVTYLHKYA